MYDNDLSYKKFFLIRIKMKNASGLVFGVVSFISLQAMDAPTTEISSKKLLLCGIVSEEKKLPLKLTCAIHKFVLTEHNDQETLSFIKSRSCRYGISDMTVALAIPTAQAAQRVVLQKKILRCWHKRNALDILAQAKEAGADLDFTYPAITGAGKVWCPTVESEGIAYNVSREESRCTPLIQLAATFIQSEEHKRSEAENLYYQIGEWFCENGADVNALTHKKENALIVAISYGNHPLALRLIQSKHLNLDQQDDGGATALHKSTLAATAFGTCNFFMMDSFMKIMQALIEKGANPFIVTKDSDSTDMTTTPLQLSLKWSNIPMLAGKTALELSFFTCTRTGEPDLFCLWGGHHILQDAEKNWNQQQKK